MEYSGDSLDAILMDLYKQLVCGSYNVGSRGETMEMLAVALRITKPRARISRSENRGKAFSALGELLWYFTKSDSLEFIEPYIPAYAKEARNGHLYGAYGPRLFSMRKKIDQLENVKKLLTERQGSRRAVIQLFDAEDIVDIELPEVPCTTALQFHVRDGFLHLSVTMRSNDAFKGLPHDVFCFTMLQEMMARQLNVELGEYYHYAGSMHIYLEDIEKVNSYIAEGYQRTVEMPPMPYGNPFDLIPKLLEAEEAIRCGKEISAIDILPDNYWSDIIRLIQVFWATGRKERLETLETEFVCSEYRTYLAGREDMMPRDSICPTTANIKG